MTDPNDLQSVKFVYENSVRNVFSLMTKIDDNNRDNYTFIKLMIMLKKFTINLCQKFKNNF